MEILAVVFLISFASIVSAVTLPSNLHENETTTCEEFGQFARFNPFSVLDNEWMVFYYWGPPQNAMFVKFTIPTKIQISYLKYVLNGHVLNPINWKARQLLMKERDNSTYLLVEQSDRGKYLLYQPLRGLAASDVLPSVEIRIKQTGDSKYIGMMTCVDQIAYVFAKTTDIPKKNELQDAAARIGFRGRGGKSYLYRGHEWMPIPEADDRELKKTMKFTEQVMDNRL